ncbi:MAG: hypothetical protein K2K58_04870, partial [Muribaculaceae bacterium]|nr:hypothetical protein [Muribaculaceae bacterium]
MKRLTSILRLISIVLTMTGAFNLYASSTIQTGDTLCSAKTASELSIFFNTGYISITVKNINGSGENYFYKTGVSEKRKKGDSSMTIMHDVSGLSIMEVDGKNIEISYKGQNNELSNLTYNIPDPENRFVNSYSGWRGDEFGLSIGRKGKSRWSIVSTGLGMGWLATVNASPALSTSMGHSMEWTWLSVLGVNWRLGAHSLTAGLGIYWRNYSLDEGLYFEKEDGKVVVEEFSPEMKK